MPAKVNDNSQGLPEKIRKKIGEQITSAAVKVAHRVQCQISPPTETSSSSLLIAGKRDAVLEKARKTGVGRSGLDFARAGPVFVNEHFRHELSKLLSETVSKKKNARLEFVPKRNGKMLVHPAETSSVVKLAGPYGLVKISTMRSWRYLNRIIIELQKVQELVSLNRSFFVCHTRSIQSECDGFNLLLSNMDALLDVIMFRETWYSDYSDYDLISNYNDFALSQSNQRSGGFLARA